ncbi:MAG TPA: DsbA family protein [Ktedonobacteraceae bacterium]
MGDTAVLRAVAEEVRLNTKDFEQILASEAFNEQVNADVEMARAYGLTGVAALIFDDRYLVRCAQPYQVLKQVVERVIEEEKGGGEGERQ